MRSAGARLRIGIVAPSAATRRTGNMHTAQRYAAIFRSAGHQVRIIAAWDAQPFDILVALHARKSARSVSAFSNAYPDRPIIVVLTGTDVYRDLKRSRRAMNALVSASAIVTLQREAITCLPHALRSKATAIVQSAVAPAAKPRRDSAPLQVCVLGHLRSEKDPMRVGYALRHIPSNERVQVVQAGSALDPRYARMANAIGARDRRYRWIGEISHARALALLARSDILALCSKMEGGANAICEAIAAGVAVIASDISGNIGLLGPSYPGYFPLGDTRACAALLQRCATDAAFLAKLRREVRALRPLVRPSRERAAWLDVLKRVCR